MCKLRKIKGFTLPEVLFTLVIVSIASAVLYTSVGGFYGVSSTAKTKILFSQMAQVRGEVIKMHQSLGSAPIVAGALIKESEYTGKSTALTLTITSTVEVVTPAATGPTTLSQVNVTERVSPPQRHNLYDYDEHNTNTGFIRSNIAEDNLVGSGIESYFNLDDILGGKRGYLRAYREYIFYIIAPFNVDLATAEAFDNSAFGKMLASCNDYKPVSPEGDSEDTEDSAPESETTEDTGSPDEEGVDTPPTPSAQLNQKITSYSKYNRNSNNNFFIEGGCYFYTNDGNRGEAWNIAGMYTPAGKTSLVYLLMIDHNNVSNGDHWLDVFYGNHQREF